MRFRGRTPGIGPSGYREGAPPRRKSAVQRSVRERARLLDVREVAVEDLEHPVGVLDHPQVVRDHDPGLPAGLDLPAQQLDHAAAHRGVEGGGRLVDEDEVRVVHQGPPDRHPLPLAAGQLLRAGCRRGPASPSSSRSWSHRAWALLLASRP